MNDREMRPVIYRAYLRDGKKVHYGEPLLIACMLKTKGKGRNSKDMRDVQKIMRDHNLDRN